jgi:hypothetical protein
LAVQLFGADMAAGGEKGADDPLALLGGLETRAGQVLDKASDSRLGIGHERSAMKMNVIICRESSAAPEGCQGGSAASKILYSICPPKRTLTMGVKAEI